MNTDKTRLPTLQKDYRFFDPKEYLAEYYIDVGQENRAILDFQAEAYKRIFSDIKKGRLLEFGGGPTIYQLISAAKYPVSIDFCDYVVANLNEVKVWLKDKPESYNWDNFIKYVLKRERYEGTSLEIKRRADLIRKKVKRLFSCDIRKSEPLSISPQPSYEVVSVNFVPESITDSKDEWNDFIERLVSLVKPKGYLLMGAITGAKYYRSGQVYFPAAQVSSAMITEKLRQQNLSVLMTDFVKAEDQTEQGYEGIFMVLSGKNH